MHTLKCSCWPRSPQPLPVDFNLEEKLQPAKAKGEEEEEEDGDSIDREGAEQDLEGFDGEEDAGADQMEGEGR